MEASVLSGDVFLGAWWKVDCHELKREIPGVDAGKV